MGGGVFQQPARVSESLRWSEGYERLAEMAPLLPQTRLVCLADREADILELMLRARKLQTPVDWQVRCKHNRALAACRTHPFKNPISFEFA